MIRSNKPGLIIAVAVILIIVLGLLFGSWYRSTYIRLNGQTLRRDITTLDLHDQPLPPMYKLAALNRLETLDLTGTGLTPSQYDYLRRNLPDCNILWSVPFGGGYLDMNITALTVTELRAEDVPQIRYLEKLNTVDAIACRDYDALALLLDTYPELFVRLRVTVGSEMYTEDTTELTVANTAPFQLENALNCLPHLKKVTFTGISTDNWQLIRWKEDYPNILFVWKFNAFGTTASSLDTELLIEGATIDSVEELEAIIPCFYDLQKLEVFDSGLPNEDLDALWKRHPETRIIWNVMVGKCNLRTDVTSFMPFKFGYWNGGSLTDTDAEALKYCVDMVCMDLGHMKKITNYEFLTTMTKLEYLILADTKGTDFSPLASLTELKYLEVFLTSFDQAEVLLGLTKLEDLNLGYTKISNVESLQKMTWLKNLWLPVCKNLTAQQRQALDSRLTNTRINYYGAGSTGYGWRELPNYREMRKLLGMPVSEGW